MGGNSRITDCTARISERVGENDIRSAILLALELREMCRAEYGDSHRFYVRSLLLLADLYASTGNAAQAQAALLQALVILKKHELEGSRLLPTVLAKLSAVYAMQGRADAALPLQREAEEVAAQGAAGKARAASPFRSVNLVRVGGEDPLGALDNLELKAPRDTPEITSVRRQRGRSQGGVLSKARALLRFRKFTAADCVECSVFAPATVAPNTTFMVQAFAHLYEQMEETKHLARQYDVDTSYLVSRSLDLEIARGTQLLFRLSVPGLEIDEPVQTLVWRGHPEPVQFGVHVPDSIEAGTLIGSLSVAMASIPVGHIKFKLKIGTDAQAQEETELAEESAQRYRSVFISYASEDRDEVVKRVQLLRALHIHFFQDIWSLEPGARWEKMLYRYIDESDLFLLFWSNTAKNSAWVTKEVSYALSRKAQDETKPPEIIPIPLEGPPVVTPPEGLQGIHFADPMLYLLLKSQGN